jgi:TolB-like protein/AraC-like DNA-binding protein/Tfp pilus assembly protein PilF
MSESPQTENSFLAQLTSIIEKNMANEQFGVSELADDINMSRSNLLRKVKKETNLSVSQLISEVRLKRAMDLLKAGSLNVSEVSHEVGFGSTSYFIKCFREYYGYPPGEAGKRSEVEVQSVVGPSNIPASDNRRKYLFISAIILVIAMALVAHFLWPSVIKSSKEKAIAVLPFKNDSSDSANVYLINGLMESTLNNLQNIKDLKVISRTSSEKYRNTRKSIPEMGKELNVNYFVEGSGQKIGNQILLNIQLIDAANDKHLWSRQYKREAKDIFELQQEIAKSIASEIEVIITPEEAKRIDKKPTDNLEAYDELLKGRDLIGRDNHGDLNKALIHFKKAVALDTKFALAYADMAFVYYYLDIFQTEKKYSEDINTNADKALLLDPKSPNSLIAKGLFYMHNKEYEASVPYFEKALEYNPNSALVINFLSELYNFYLPNTTKYLYYSLMGARLDITANDSITTSYNYLHLSNALIQTGFVDESLKYIDKSLAYNPKNPYSGWVKVFILYAKNRDPNQTKKLLLEALKKDTTNLILYEEVGKVCYLMRDYESAYHYFTKFNVLKKKAQLDLFKHESLKMAVVFGKTGHPEEAEEYAMKFKDFADQDKSIYHTLDLAAYYAYRGDKKKSLDYMKLFSKEDNYQYWILLLETDPIVDLIKDDPECKKILKEISSKFWKTHDRIKEDLQDQGLLQF